jgi:hypothetical protein
MLAFACSPPLKSIEPLDAADILNPEEKAKARHLPGFVVSTQV